MTQPHLQRSKTGDMKSNYMGCIDNSKLDNCSEIDTNTGSTGYCNGRYYCYQMFRKNIRLMFITKL